jgi:hypothetical protein
MENMSLDSLERIAWPFLALVAGAILIYPGAKEFIQGASVMEWAPEITLGVLFLAAYFGRRLASWIEGDQVANDGYGFTDWVTLITFGSWVAAGLVFLAAGYPSFTVKAYTALGAVGVAGMLYKLYRVSQRQTQLAL